MRRYIVRWRTKYYTRGGVEFVVANSLKDAKTIVNAMHGCYGDKIMFDEVKSVENLLKNEGSSS